MTSVDARPGWHPALTGVSLLLLDFDGPVIRLLPDPEHVRLAEGLRRWCADRTGQLPRTPAVEHVAVLRHIHRHYPDLAAEAEALTTAGELAAAAAHEAYPDAIGTMRRWLAGGGRLAIVSNNAEQAVRQVLARTELGNEDLPNGYTVHARRAAGIEQLKPDPHLLLQAMRAHATPADQTIMIGDTASDVRAGQAAGVPTIGVAASADRAAELRRAGAVAVVTRLADLRTMA